MSQSLPLKPSLEHLKKQAKELLTAYERGETEAVQTVSTYFPAGAKLSLTQAQLVLARGYGFPSWIALSRHLEGSAGTLDEFIDTALGGQLERAKELWHGKREALRLSPAAAALAGDMRALNEALAADPTLVNRAIGPKDRPLLCYTCFSRLIADPEFKPGILATAKFLLDAGADPDSFYMAEWGGEKFRSTAIYGAAGALNDAALTKLLLKAGADPNEGEPNPERYPGEALYHACDHPGHNECLKLLLEAGTSQAGRDYCILRKLDFEDQEGVLLFLEHGANPNRGWTRTALSHALLRNRSLGMIQLLLDHGADPNAKDHDGMTPYVVARRYGRTDAAELLAERGANTDLSPYDSLLAAAADGDTDRVKEIAKEHPEVLTQLTNYGRQEEGGLPLGAPGDLLNDMARAGQAAGLAALLDLGMDPGHRNNYNETPLHWACVAGRVEAAKVLVERGAPMDVTEKNHGADPIGWACWGSLFWQEPQGDYPATVEYMLAHGARVPNPGDGSPGVQEVLRAHGAG